MALFCAIETTRGVPQEKFPRKPYHKSFIDLTFLMSRWLDIGRVLFLRVLDRNGVDVHKHAKKETQNQERELDPQGTKTLITNLPQLIYSRFLARLDLRRIESRRMHGE